MIENQRWRSRAYTGLATVLAFGGVLLFFVTLYKFEIPGFTSSLETENQKETTLPNNGKTIPYCDAPSSSRKILKDWLGNGMSGMWGGRLFDEITRQGVAGCAYSLRVKNDSKLLTQGITDSEGKWAVPSSMTEDNLNFVFAVYLSEYSIVEYYIMRRRDGSPIDLPLPATGKLEVSCSGVPEGCTWSVCALPINQSLYSQVPSGPSTAIKKSLTLDNIECHMTIKGFSVGGFNAQDHKSFFLFSGFPYDLSVIVDGFKTDVANFRIEAPNVVSANIVGVSGSFRVKVIKEDGGLDVRGGNLFIRSGRISRIVRFERGELMVGVSGLNNFFSIYLRMDDGEYFHSTVALEDLRREGCHVFYSGDGMAARVINLDKPVASVVFEGKRSELLILGSNIFASQVGEGFVSLGDGRYAIQPGCGNFKSMWVVGVDGDVATDNLCLDNISPLSPLPSRKMVLKIDQIFSFPRIARSVNFVLEASIRSQDGLHSVWVKCKSGSSTLDDNEQVLVQFMQAKGIEYRIRGAWFNETDHGTLGDFIVPSW